MILGKAIYISANGNDKNTGISPDKAFKTIDAAVKNGILDDTQILIEGGYSYRGSFLIRDKANIFISGYGAGYPIVLSENNTAMKIENSNDITVAGLVLEGAGFKTFNQSNGIECNGCKDITISAVEVRKFHRAGITINGCMDVEVNGCYAHDNGAVGICTGSYDGVYSENVRIAYCRAYDNAGDLTPGIRVNHSGSGIIIAGVSHCLVEYCDAAGNGWAQRQRYVNGPVGIWCCCGCDDVVFRYNLGRYNRTQPGGVDGDGFDIDGEVKNAVMEYNYSYGNEGSGYLLCEFYGDCTDTLWDNNITRYNISFSDATRVSGYGPINISSPVNIEFDKLYIYDNLFVAREGLHAVYNKGIPLTANDMSITENILITDGKKPFEVYNQPNVTIGGNIELIDKSLQRDIEDKAPLLVHPRALTKQPVFKLLKDKKCYETITEQGAIALFHTNKKEEFSYAFKMMELQMYGPDFFGMDMEGDASLYYDSLYPSVITRLQGAGSRFWAPIPWWEKDKRYVFTARVRLTSVDDRAFMFMMDEKYIVYKKVYFNHSVDGYFEVHMEFIGNDKWFDPGKIVGIEYESGSGSLYVHDITFYELHADDETVYEKFDDSFKTYGDVFYDNGYEMYGCSSIQKTICEPIREVVFDVESNCMELVAYIKGETTQMINLVSGKNHISIPTGEIVDFIIMQPFGDYTTSIKNMEGN